jgi:hypothetical protein
MTTTDRLATPEELAAYLSRPPKILAEWRSQGRGPKYLKIEGAQIRYSWDDIHDWLRQQAVTPGSAC